MARTGIAIAARGRGVALFLMSALCVAAAAQTPTSSDNHLPTAVAVISPMPPLASPLAPTQAATASSEVPDAGAVRADELLQESTAGPAWADLTSAQQEALAPLSGEWNGLDLFRKNKWLAISDKFGTMKPDEQQRMQERMYEWAQLTPEQRRIVRTNYTRAKKLNPNQKVVQWEQYQQLPDDQKKKLAAAARSKKTVVTVLPPSVQRPSNKTTVAPITSAPKPVQEQSAMPQTESRSTLPPSFQPIK